MTLPLTLLAALAVAGGALNLPGTHALGTWLEHTLGELGHTGEFDPRVALLSTVLSVVALCLSWVLFGRRGARAALEAAQQAGPASRPASRPAPGASFVDRLYDALVVRPYERLSAFLANVVDWGFWHEFFHDGVIARSYRGLSRFLSDVVDTTLWHDRFHDLILARGFRGLSFLAANPIDLGIIDGLANGTASLVRRLSGALRITQTGKVRNYAFSVFIGVIVILGTLVIFR
jgi:NADH:ubiquinone oxidoreductase subunit 5 (subunit L)/multisubunit Na+/H+ antiporter MnhA subunit